jgi:hypothetical protein
VGRALPAEQQSGRVKVIVISSVDVDSRMPRVREFLNHHATLIRRNDHRWCNEVYVIDKRIR